MTVVIKSWGKAMEERGCGGSTQSAKKNGSKQRRLRVLSSSLFPFIAALLMLMSISIAGCESPRTGSHVDQSAEKTIGKPRGKSSPASPQKNSLLPTSVAAAPRVVAIGDVHGDLDVTRAALRLAGAIDDKGNWIGGDLVVVQLGDQIDRGDDDRAIIDFFERLMPLAKAKGGAVYPLLGNHELMVARGDTRYVTSKSFASFSDVKETLGAGAHADELRRIPKPRRGHRAAFRPGGPYARILARRAVAMKVGKTLFVHGGLLPSHAKDGLDAISADVRAWLNGDGETPARFSEDATDRPLWSRRYSMSPSVDDCKILQRTLRAFGVDRMVVAHTVQPDGIRPACGDDVWRIDVGLSRFYQGPLQVLEIRGDDVRVITAESVEVSAE